MAGYKANISLQNINLIKEDLEGKAINKVIETKLKPKAIGIPENKTIKVKTATINAIIKGSII